MAAPTVYKSSDTDAPVLNGQKGSLINVLTACLVDGYSSGGTRKDAAGWTIATGPTNNKIIYRNNATTGSGTYFRVQDNGRIASGPTSYHTTDRDCNAALVGMTSFSDIDTPVTPFPRVITGGDLHDAYAYGVGIRKAYDVSNPTYSRPWMVIADNRTCWIVTTCAQTNTAALPTTRSATTNGGVGIHGFGDLLLFNDQNTNCAKAFTLGGSPGTLDIGSAGGSVGTVSHYNLGRIGFGILTNIYLSRSFETSGSGVAGYIKFQKLFTSAVPGGACTPNPEIGTYSKYYDGVTKLDINRLIVCEYMNDSIRTYKTTVNHSTEFAFLPGLVGCLHTTSSGVTGRIGDEFSTVTNYGDSYLLCSQYNENFTSNNSSLFAFSLDDWWA